MKLCVTLKMASPGQPNQCGEKPIERRLESWLCLDGTSQSGIHNHNCPSPSAAPQCFSHSMTQSIPQVLG
jgi:hypothetical protein